MTTLAPSKNYADYVVSEPGKPSTSYNATSTTSTGFLEFKPRDMDTQTKYDAMSPSWQGVASSTVAVARGDYSLDSAETTRRELREKVHVPTGEVPITAYWKNIGPTQPTSNSVQLTPPVDMKACIIQ